MSFFSDDESVNMDDIGKRASLWEVIANERVLGNRMNTHLAVGTRVRRYREAFGITPVATELLWTALDFYNEGPKSTQREHLLWTMLLLKVYGTTHDLAGRCGVDEKTFRKWTDLVIDRLADLEVVSTWRCVCFD